MAAIAESKKCLLVGYGNPYRGDEGLGPHVVDGLRDTIQPYLSEVSIMTLTDLDVTLTSELCRTLLVIFVDARHDRSEELVRVKRVRPCAGSPARHPDSEPMSVPLLLRMALDRYGAAPRCYVVMPKGYDFSESELVSGKAEIAAVHAKNEIMEILEVEAGIAPEASPGSESHSVSNVTTFWPQKQATRYDERAHSLVALR